MYIYILHVGTLYVDPEGRPEILGCGMVTYRSDRWTARLIYGSHYIKRTYGTQLMCACLFVCMLSCFMFTLCTRKMGLISWHCISSWNPGRDTSLLGITFYSGHIRKCGLSVFCHLKRGQHSRNYVCVSGNWVPARMAMLIGKIRAGNKHLWYPISSQTPFYFMIMLLFHHSSWSCAIPCVISLKQRAGGFYTHFISDLKVRGFPDNDHQNINQFAADLCGAAIQKATG